MRDFKKKTKKHVGKPVGVIFALAALGTAFYLGNSVTHRTMSAFSASDFESTPDGGSPIIILNPGETTTERTVDLFGPEETTPERTADIFNPTETSRDGIGIIGEGDTTTLQDGIDFIREDETTTLREGIGTVSDTAPPTGTSSGAGTSEPPVSSDPNADPPALILTYYTFNLTVGQEQQIYWKVENSVINNYIELFSSDNPAVASVSDTGVITARAAGTANITVTWGDLTATAEVSVSEASTAVVTAPPVTAPPSTDPIDTAAEPGGEDPAITDPVTVLPKVKLNGCLYDTKGEAVPSIMLTAGGQTAITDINGFFSFYDLDMRETVLSVSGNDRLTCTVSLLSDTTVYLIYNGEAIECCSSYEEMASRFVITKINLETPNRRIYAGDTVIPYYQYEPRDASVTETQFMSSNEGVARIDKNGVISAIAEGETVITIILNNGQARTEFTLTVSPDDIGKYSGLIAAGETLLVLIAAGGAFVVYKRYKKKLVGEENEEDED